MAVGGFFFDFEAISDHDAPRRHDGPLADSFRRAFSPTYGGLHHHEDAGGPGRDKDVDDLRPAAGRVVRRKRDHHEQSAPVPAAHRPPGPGE